jgi:nicotinamide riboside kinase
MKIAIVGSHCTGKTSLIDKLQAEPELYDYSFYPEAIREISRLNFPTNERAGDCSQLAMLSLHLLHLRNENMVTDRCILDNYVYAYMLKAMGANISDKCINTLQSYFIDNINSYDIYAFCPVQFKMKNDGFRMIDKKVQDDISEEILSTLIKYVPEERYILLMGDTEERAKQLLEFKRAKEKLNG